MQYLDEYRNSDLLKTQLANLRSLITRRWVVMDVCGGQTHSFLRSGLEAALDDVVELVHGPGCPVCVTPAQVIDDAIDLAQRNTVIATFGDMLRVPGSTTSLLQARAAGGDIRTVYSPIDAVLLAQKNPGLQVVFIAVGFETTMPSTALAVAQARQLGLTNFSLLAHHVRVEPAMRTIMMMPANRIEGFLAAGHVCAVTGYQRLSQFAEQFRVPIVVTGFEPLDLLIGLTECITSLEQNRTEVRNLYPRAVHPEGNSHAIKWIDEVYQIATVPWRGMGEIPDGGFVIRSEWRQFDARHRYKLDLFGNDDDAECRSGDIMSGRLKPHDCPLFGNRCVPDHPIGAPMVSSEGCCAAYYRYTAERKMHQ